MKKELIKAGAVIVAVAGLACVPSAMALPNLNGGLSFSGGAIFDTSNPGTSTELKGILGAQVTAIGTSGSFAVIPVNNAVTTLVTAGTPWAYGSGFAGIWSTTFGGETFSFDLNTSSVSFRGTDNITVQGTGTIHGSGVTAYADTTGNWTFQGNTSGAGTFAFGASTSAVPDSGMTLLLLGMGLAALGVFAVSRKQVLA